MPTYEYQCAAGHTFELVQKMNDKPRARCPACGKPAVRVISGGAGLIFKGSGFYITDYGKDGKGPRKVPEGDTAPAVAPAAEAKPETKPEPAKADPRPDPVASKSAQKKTQKKATE